MITVLMGKKIVNLPSEEEKKVYDKLLREFGRGVFEDVIETDENNNIVCIDILKNDKVSYAVMWFLMTLMVNQRLAGFDDIEKRIKKIEEVLKIVS